MKVYIDIGNTSTSIYKVDKKDKTKINVKTTCSNKLIMNIKKELITNQEIESFFLSSVVPDVEVIVKNFLKSFNKPIINFTHKYYNLVVDYKHLNYQNIGADRIIVDSASMKYSKNCIVIDLGTATSIDIIKNGKYISGYIYPGLETSKKALILAASQLNNYSYKNIQTDGICIDTESQINDGIIFGMLGAIAKLVNKCEEHFINKEYKIVVTGGFFNYIVELLTLEVVEKELGNKYIYDKNLIIDGMQLLEKEIKSL